MSTNNNDKRLQVKRRAKRRKVCHYCAEGIHRLDYKEIASFKRFVTDRGKIHPRRNSGICAKHQRMLATAVKRARFMALIPYSID